jgi:hypothetical protein
LFNDRALEHLNFNVIDGQFQIDPRFTPYENFEKSCLDLDLEVPLRMDNSFTFTVNPPLFFGIWHRMVYFNSLETSLPHVDFINAPEFKIVEAILQTHVNRLDGAKTSLPVLNAWLNLAIYQAFEVTFKQSGQNRFISEDTPPIIMKQYFFRPGFPVFYERALNRTLRILQMRRCDCASQKDLHLHGGREFYNPERCIGEWTTQRSEVYFWQRSPEGQRYLSDFRAKLHSK